jgi:NAD(P)-dependent dehydrogenase (short-subunit alcohol dehydrogenase family)
MRESRNEARPLLGKVGLVTGGSRGIGAEVAEELARNGADVVITYREKRARAARVAAKVEEHGRRAVIAKADLTVPEEMRELMELVQREFGTLDLLILNASGGLERDRPSDYAMQLNADGQERAVDLSLPLMPSGSRIVFVTSHMAHFYGKEPQAFAGYEPIAASKSAGEAALRARIPALADDGVSFVVVSGDFVEGTTMPQLLERAMPGSLERRRRQVGALPTVVEFAQAIVAAGWDTDLTSGAVIFVGDTISPSIDDDDLGSALA